MKRATVLLIGGSLVVGSRSWGETRRTVLLLCVCAVRQLGSCLERARAQLTRRSVELEDMTLEWRQFDETMSEFERWVAVVEDDCQTHALQAADAFTLADLTRLIADNHVSTQLSSPPSGAAPWWVSLTVRLTSCQPPTPSPWPTSFVSSPTIMLVTIALVPVWSPLVS